MPFVVFEGIDGAGKSTLISGLVDAVKSTGQEVVLTREPGGSQLGDELRSLLLRVNGEAPCPRAELLLYEAARAQHVDLKIRPALQKKSWVVSDRFYAASVAFQVGGRGLDRGLVDTLNTIAVDGTHPDIWVLLDLPTEHAHRRMMGRDLDRFELEKQDFHERVRQSYLDLAKEDPKKWLVLDARKTPDELKIELLTHFKTKGLL